MLQTMDDAARFHMPLYLPGTVVQVDSKRETISHIIVRRHVLLVHLVGHDLPVSADSITLAPTPFTMVRV